MIAKLRNVVATKLPIVASVFRSVRDSAWQRLSKRRIQRLLDEKKELSIEVGAGAKKGVNGWTTIDLSRMCDICWDLRNGLPFPDAIVSRVYSSHFLEHLSFAEGQRFLAECLRVLIPGGEFSIAVPNGRLYIEAYANPTAFDKERFLLYRPAYNQTTKIDYVNYMAYMDGHHRYMFDEENLVHILAAAGFTGVRLRDFDPGLDRRDRNYESIYAEARRP
jgi:predicted SAM-dependent methyltransferase